MTTPKAQIGLDDEWIKDENLEALLEERENLNERRLEVGKEFRDKDAAARERIAVYDFPNDSERRCGRFIIAKKTRPAADVEFTRGGGVSIAIKPAAE